MDGFMGGGAHAFGVVQRNAPGKSPKSRRSPKKSPSKPYNGKLSLTFSKGLLVDIKKTNKK